MAKDISISAAPFSKISFFAPYINASPRADSVFMEAGTYWRYKASHLYRFNAKGVEAIGGLFVNHRDREDHGFFPMPETGDHPTTIENEESLEEVDSLKLSYVKRFIDVFENAEVDRFFRIIKFVVCGKNNENDIRIVLLDLLHCFDAVDTGHPDIHESNVGTECLGEFYYAPSGLCRLYLTFTREILLYDELK
jgi:hypothetical protein